MGFLDSSKPCPPLTITRDNKEEPNSTFLYWSRQDQLLLHAIVASISEPLIPLIASSKTSSEAWKKLSRLYANSFRSRVMTLKDKLHVPSDNKSIVEYVQNLKTIDDELALIGSSVSNDDLVLHILNGVGFEYREIFSVVRACETTIFLEKLYDKLVEYEHYLKQEENSSVVITANAASRSYNSNQRGHTSFNNHSQQGQKNYNKESPQFQALHSQDPIMENFTAAPQTLSSNWLADTSASHHVTSDLSNLSIQSDYDGTDQIDIGDGSATHVSDWC
ncbi:PREDICTED: uncharacterized protein LOC108663289 [Theobroma cacao]|uniref:Uncharacterized protein LOC108663289 n=1 Tax=Theobroma cacao TaxID=3641 RepID=A0AB32WX49_THECC|nr:PREDICTED: uncharacterized protein LOC108663289 [Theobroma cacao]